eukprot:g856.t1
MQVFNSKGDDLGVDDRRGYKGLAWGKGGQLAVANGGINEHSLMGRILLLAVLVCLRSVAAQQQQQEQHGQFANDSVVVCPHTGVFVARNHLLHAVPSVGLLQSLGYAAQNATVAADSCDSVTLGRPMQQAGSWSHHSLIGFAPAPLTSIHQLHFHQHRFCLGCSIRISMWVWLWPGSIGVEWGKDEQSILHTVPQDILSPGIFVGVAPKPAHFFVCSNTANSTLHGSFSQKPAVAARWTHVQLEAEPITEQGSLGGSILRAYIDGELEVQLQVYDHTNSVLRQVQQQLVGAHSDGSSGGEPLDRKSLADQGLASPQATQVDKGGIYLGGSHAFKSAHALVAGVSVDDRAAGEGVDAKAAAGAAGVMLVKHGRGHRHSQQQTQVQGGKTRSVRQRPLDVPRWLWEETARLLDETVIDPAIAARKLRGGQDGRKGGAAAGAGAASGAGGDAAAADASRGANADAAAAAAAAAAAGKDGDDAIEADATALYDFDASMQHGSDPRSLNFKAGDRIEV